MLSKTRDGVTAYPSGRLPMTLGQPTAPLQHHYPKTHCSQGRSAISTIPLLPTGKKRGGGGDLGEKSPHPPCPNHTPQVQKIKESCSKKTKRSGGEVDPEKKETKQTDVDLDLDLESARQEPTHKYLKDHRREGDLPERGGLQGTWPYAGQLGGPASELAYEDTVVKEEKSKDALQAMWIDYARESEERETFDLEGSLQDLYPKGR
eukprot:4424210-Pyramimonas_sp.AAC.1